MSRYDIHLRDYWRILTKRKFTVLFTALLICVFSIIFAILRAPAPLYTSACKITFERESSAEGGYPRTMSWSGANDIEIQISLIRKAEKQGEVTIVRPALLPGFPVNPPQQMTAGIVGAFVGIILGMVLAFIVETFNTSLGAIEYVEKTLKIQVLGVIPRADEKAIRKTLKDRYPEGGKDVSIAEKVPLISHLAPRSVMSESFRILRTQIQFKMENQKKTAILITSTSPWEGKTVVAVNTALTMAQAGIRTLLVEADLRNPALARIFGVDAGPGLTDVLLGNYPWPDVVNKVTDIILGKISLDAIMMTPGLDRLHFITSGTLPGNPTDLIDSERMEAFIKAAKEEYDHIIIDSPPILSTAEPTILGSRVDGVLLLYRVGTVSMGLLKRSVTRLEQVRSHILGVILNGMKPEVSPHFQDVTYDKYPYGATEDRKGQKDEALKSKKGRRISFGRLFLLLVALSFSTAGLLWQIGVIDPIQWSHVKMYLKDTGPSESTVTKEQSRSPIGERHEAQTPMTRTEETTPSDHPNSDKGEDLPPKAPENQEEKDLPKQSDLLPVQGMTPAFPYSVYLGSFRSVERTRRAINLYREKGFSAYAVKVNLGEKGLWHRVYTGHFKNRDQAEAFITDYKPEEAEVQQTIYAALLFISSEKPQEPDPMVTRLEGLGYFPYIIERPDRTWGLYVGVFTTREGAEDLVLDLKSHDIQAEVVQR